MHVSQRQALLSVKHKCVFQSKSKRNTMKNGSNHIHIQTRHPHAVMTVEARRCKFHQHATKSGFTKITRINEHSTVEYPYQVHGAQNEKVQFYCKRRTGSGGQTDQLFAETQGKPEDKRGLNDLSLTLTEALFCFCSEPCEPRHVRFQREGFHCHVPRHAKVYEMHTQRGEESLP